MNRDLSKYRLLFIITLLLICTVNVFLIEVIPEITALTGSQLTVFKRQSTNGQQLEFSTDDSVSASAGLKVEIVAISGPVASDSSDNHQISLNLQNNIYSKKKSSLISHSNLILSKTVHISPLITRLQI